MLARGLAIWSGVGLGHLAVLGALWSGPAAPLADPLLVDLLPARSAVPVALVSSPPAPPTLAPTVSAGLPATVLAGSPARPPSPPSAPPSPAPPAEVGQVEGAPPRFLERVAPLYPARARRAGIEGSVTLRLRLSAGGRLISAEVASSSGSPSLDEAALEAARASLYAPALSAGSPVASETEATYRFELR